MLPIYYGETLVGNASCRTEGLYQVIECHCRLPADSIHRLEMRFADKTVPLGVCIPEGDGYYLRKRIAVRELGQGNGRLCVAGQEDAVALTGGSSLKTQYLIRLDQARLTVRNKKQYLYFPDF